MPDTWLFDAYPHPHLSSIVVWVKHGSLITKHHLPYQPEFCIRSDQEPLETAEKILAEDSRVESTRRDEARLWLRAPKQEVLRIKPKRLQQTWSIATDLRRTTMTKGFLFFDVDHSQESRWMHSQGLWSLCQLKVGAAGAEHQDGAAGPEFKADPGAGTGGLPFQLANDEDRWSVDYPDLELRSLRLAVKACKVGHEPAFTDPLESIQLGNETLTCARPGSAAHEADTLRDLGQLLHRANPDVLTTQHGDRFDIPFLLHRIRDLKLHNRVWLGREPDPQPDKPDQVGKSIHTYGRWLYKTASYYLRGRWHIDLSKKILDSEDDRKDLHGIVYLARVANRRAQDVNRNGAGFALQQMQIDLATDWGVALPWKRNLTEDWKDAATLCAVDRGGQIMVPRAGIYDDVVACDFSGFYPGLVVAHNLSSDTMNCNCCPDGEVIPELGYHICKRGFEGQIRGHQSEILHRLAPHRKWAKAVLKRAKSDAAQA